MELDDCEAAVSLTGTLDTLNLTDLFELLAATGKSGALHVRSERGLGVVYFSGGRVCGGEAGEQSGPVADRSALLARLHDVCFELFRFEDGSFEFEGDARPAGPAAGEVDVGELLGETRRRLTEWRTILAVVPSVEVRPRLVAEPPGGTVTLDAAQWRVVTGIDGRRRVSALIRVLDGSEFEICRTLAGLVEAGLVEVDEGADAAGREPLVPPAEAALVEVAVADQPDEPDERDERDEPEGEAGPSAHETFTALEEAARAAAQEEERRRSEVVDVDPDGLNRGAVVALLGSNRRK
jgi:hypothetical protein